MPRLKNHQGTWTPQGTWTVKRFLGLVLGEICRLRDDEDGYGPRGRNFLPHVDIPEAVWESYVRVSASQWNAMGLRQGRGRAKCCLKLLSLPTQKSVLSQVPNCEAPGAPIFCGCSHFSRHLGHPPTA